MKKISPFLLSLLLLFLLLPLSGSQPLAIPGLSRNDQRQGYIRWVPSRQNFFDCAKCQACSPARVKISR